ncbi:MAG: hypothetical protein KatS3mg108_3008 [Isosphaeraceae bacterium]|nr:MAG: hypothetical protein KatS3mg108_3008 [Isosphaeraceae bacterium]
MNATRSERERSRRAFLRGLGACVALPALESLGLGRPAAAAVAGSQPVATTATGAPLRAAFLFFPNGAIPRTWWPEQPGADFALSRTLEPLAPVRDRIQVLGGLKHEAAEAGPDGAGDHARGNGTFLTGVRLKKSATDIRAGVSIDQVMARAIGTQTRFPSLELSCDPARRSGACDSGYACAYQFNLSWRTPTTPMAAESNPRLAFERLFGEGPPGQRAANLRRRREEQRSVLDYVLEDARAMKRRLSARDREKLDQYLSGVREVEARIEAAERFGEPEDPGIETPSGIPADYGDYLGVMFDLLVLAFQTDSTRVATFLLAHDGSNRSFEQIGITEGHHDLSHHQNRPEWIEKLSDIDRWYVAQFSKFLQKLAATPDVDGRTLLDNAMIVYGSGNADGNRHTHDNLPVILAGGGGGTLTTGRYVRYRSTPMTNLFLSLADRMGLDGLERFGDSTGRLTDL